MKGQLSSVFEMKDLREAKRTLSMKIKRNSVKGKVSLTQKSYLQKVLQKFNIGSGIKFISVTLASFQVFS